MNFLLDQVEKALNSRTSAPKIGPPVRNRVDADPSLLDYHESGTGHMPSPKPTNFLPCRTHLATNPFTEIAKAQSEAYYEEILTIPAASLGMPSEFSAGHWYVVDPVTYYQVRDLNSRVLKDLKECLEVVCPNELFIRKAKQEFAFKNARTESTEEIKKELVRREKRGEIGEEDGYVGDWDVLSAGEACKGDDDDVKKADVFEHGDESQTVSHHTKEALEEAAEAGRRAAEEAKILDEWHLDV